MTRRSLFRSVAAAFTGSLLTKLPFSPPAPKLPPVSQDDLLGLGTWTDYPITVSDIDDLVDTTSAWKNYTRQYERVDKEMLTEMIRRAMLATDLNPPAFPGIPYWLTAREQHG